MFKLTDAHLDRDAEVEFLKKLRPWIDCLSREAPVGNRAIVVRHYQKEIALRLEILDSRTERRPEYQNAPDFA